MASAGASPKSRANKVLPSNDLPCISKVQADLLFKKHTGLTKNKLPPSNAVASSFARDKQIQSQKDKLQGLNVMDYNTYLYALSDIANTLYGEYFHSVTQAREYRGEA